ncbi:hypothetical protein GNI_152600 [Gregarina niphandrodes]|uniref:Uncharacterized protein n=1 Tax=Gregarina niphandrodes TaxID=110365 RepID=A0A023AZU4_GRENI|nr:hypothetical protein GNI_152600 [Gregarina niphandrodes]EZG44088.1 hypothetical protein GNI_152600 [Gregarina niphandrodes]|eukprot:XP_011132815.1 hypothetical protein GNI_152600 [Gregarina niphandrodes]
MPSQKQKLPTTHGPRVQGPSELTKSAKAQDAGSPQPEFDCVKDYLIYVRRVTKECEHRADGSQPYASQPDPAAPEAVSSYLRQVLDDFAACDEGLADQDLPARLLEIFALFRKQRALQQRLYNARPQTAKPQSATANPLLDPIPDPIPDPDPVPDATPVPDLNSGANSTPEAEILMPGEAQLELKRLAELCLARRWSARGFEQLMELWNVLLSLDPLDILQPDVSSDLGIVWRSLGEERESASKPGREVVVDTAPKIALDLQLLKNLIAAIRKGLVPAV